MKIWRCGELSVILQKLYEFQNTLMKKNTFSLFDFCKKNASKMEVYGKETLDEGGNLISFIDQAAIITRYLHIELVV